MPQSRDRMDFFMMFFLSFSGGSRKRGPLLVYSVSSCTGSRSLNSTRVPLMFTAVTEAGSMAWGCAPFIMPPTRPLEKGPSLPYGLMLEVRGAGYST